MQHRFQNISYLAGQAAPKVYLACRHFHLPRQVSYTARSFAKTERGKLGSWSACPIAFLPNRIAAGQAVMLHAVHAGILDLSPDFEAGCPKWSILGFYVVSFAKADIKS